MTKDNTMNNTAFPEIDSSSDMTIEQVMKGLYRLEPELGSKIADFIRQVVCHNERMVFDRDFKRRFTHGKEEGGGGEQKSSSLPRLRNAGTLRPSSVQDAKNTRSSHKKRNGDNH